MAKIGHHEWAIAHARCSVWVKNEKCQKIAKNDPTIILELFCIKTPSKKHLIHKKRILKSAKSAHHAWAISHAKWSVWVRNEKCQKGAKNDHTTTLELL